MTGTAPGPLARFLVPVMLMAGMSNVSAQSSGGIDFDALPLQPFPAELRQRADKDLALDVIWTGERYVVAGDRGHILVSNTGEDWVQVEVPVRAALTALHFIDAEQGWAVGHDATILKTTDGGRSWTLQNFEPAREEPFHDVMFFDAQHGIAIGAYGLAYETSDGGESWGELDAPAIRDDEFHLNSIVRLADGRLLIVGEYGLLGMADDLDSDWRRLQPPYSSSLFGALPLTDGGALIYGLRGNAFISRDPSIVPDIDPDFDPVLGTGGIELTGEGWEAIATGTTNTFFGGVALEKGGFALVGLNGQVVRIDDDGTLRDALRTESESPLAGAQLGPGEDLILVGEGGIEHLDLR